MWDRLQKLSWRQVIALAAGILLLGFAAWRFFSLENIGTNFGSEFFIWGMSWLIPGLLGWGVVRLTLKPPPHEKR